MDQKKLTSMEIDAIGEILNISLGASATAVSTMLNARVDITTPIVQVKSKDEFEFSNLEPAVGVEITYVEGLTGSNIMLLKRKDVKIIVEMLMGMEISDEDFELDEMNISAICEVMNQMMGASSTALSELLAKTVNISTPVSFEVESTEQFKEKYFTDKDAMAVVGFDLKIGEQLQSQFMNLMPIELAKELVSEFFPEGMAGDEEAEPAESPEQPPEQSESSTKAMSQEEVQALFAAQQEAEPAESPEHPADQGESSTRAMSQEEVQALFAAQQEPVSEPAPAQATPSAPPPQAAAVQTSSADTAMMQQMMDMMKQQLEMQQQQIQQLQKTAAAEPKQIKVSSPPQPSLKETADDTDPDANLDLIMGVPLDISVEIGRTKKQVKDILELNKGSLVVLDKLAGEQVDVFVNGQCIAKGDVVVVEDSFGVRVTEIVQDELVIE